MLIRRISTLELKSKFVVHCAVFATHTNTCPSRTQKPGEMTALCKGTSKGSNGSRGGKGFLDPGFKRALRSGKCRLGFIPEEWFLFFHSKTGVSGPYILGIALANYLISKEIYILEHEYYLGLSILTITILVVKKFGPGIGASLDKGVDDVVAIWDKNRNDEITFYKAAIKDAKDAQWRAEGQEQLMEAKKENISMQLEAAYRQRFMQVYNTVRGRMDYHIKKHRAEARVHQKWMIDWILENVMKSITPEFQKAALNSAIQDLAAVANRKSVK